MKSGKCVVCKLVAFLAGLGALNWGLLTFAHVNIVSKFLGPVSMASKVVYGVISLAGVVVLLSACGICCPCCKSESCDKK